uniref:Uncharacterized protein n=2 Tax=Anas platyrhynchos TaxID=8839 RepID=A0A493T0J1_ANAPP
MSKLHGNIFTLWLANVPVIVLQGYQAVKEGMTAHAEEVAGRPQNLAFEILTHGRGVMFSNGHLWKQQRRFGLVTMRKMGVGKKDQECQIQEEACHLVEYLRGTNEKVQKELDAVLGSSNVVCYMDRKRLPYTNAVIHEIQRFSNIVLIALPRKTMKDTELLGYPIPKVQAFLVNIDSVLSDPEKWETPDQFNPGHFLDKDGNFVHREAFLPFSIGSRVCMGELLARLELFIVFSTLLRAFKFTLPDGVKEVNTKFVFGSIMKPPPFQLCAVPR